MSTLQEKGITAVNQDFSRYEQLEKEQTYHLAESGDGEQLDDDYEVES